MTNHTKTLSLLIAFLILSLHAYSQTFKKDMRPDSLKDDFMDEYQAGQISKLDLLSAMNSLGVRVFNCNILPRFTKSYKLVIDVDEYVNGKMVGTKSVSPNEKNIYFFWEGEKQYADYINKIKFISRDVDSLSVLSVNVMGNTTGGIKLKKHSERKYQFYSWRRYSVTNWALNTKTPMLIYSSSWYDKRFDIERSCGAVDLSNNQAATKELLENSPHYFVVSYKVSE
ncbi:DUF5041 domain-containing protein [Mucilaginibacter litoreus]|uniref:DUF5041 domain-containing protein n=1 Tax=Mucilaginibacter litoreus TaxID=1048221 RepID=A0ABW3APR6_9SPHI